MTASPGGSAQERFAHRFAIERAFDALNKYIRLFERLAFHASMEHAASEEGEEAAWRKEHRARRSVEFSDQRVSEHRHEVLRCLKAAGITQDDFEIRDQPVLEAAVPLRGKSVSPEQIQELRHRLNALVALRAVHCDDPIKRWREEQNARKGPLTQADLPRIESALRDLMELLAGRAESYLLNRAGEELLWALRPSRPLNTDPKLVMDIESSTFDVALKAKLIDLSDELCNPFPSFGIRATEHPSQWLARLIELQEALRAATPMAVPLTPQVLQSSRRWTSALAPTATSTCKPDGMTWKEAAERLNRLRLQGEAWTSHEDMSGRLGCSAATTHKAVQKATELQAWAKPQAPAVLRAQSTTDVVMASTPQSRVADPADDAAIREYLERDLHPEERAFFLGLSREHQIEFLDDPDQHDKILGRRA